MKCILIAMATTVVGSLSGNAQEHQHGADGIPDWYDSDCCDKRHCHPVDDSEIAFEYNTVKDSPVVIYTPSGSNLPVEYIKSRWRKSQDERYHACHSGTYGYCVYIRAGV
jgi:hypothetical protein